MARGADPRSILLKYLKRGVCEICCTVLFVKRTWFNNKRRREILWVFADAYAFENNFFLWWCFCRFMLDQSRFRRRPAKRYFSTTHTKESENNESWVTTVTIKLRLVKWGNVINYRDTVRWLCRSRALSGRPVSNCRSPRTADGFGIKQRWGR